MKNFIKPYKNIAAGKYRQRQIPAKPNTGKAKYRRSQIPAKPNIVKQITAKPKYQSISINNPITKSFYGFQNKVFIFVD
ncbi:MAG: hypothetical protein A2W91_11380 [Bacteroidetes bacterium GWF2_38_335]|nr:MAG: hypothetical protein A2W91_11380 [Bacteroidetes bacterium GWF2_38_335]